MWYNKTRFTAFIGEFSATHSTYFAIYSWVDPGLISYFATPNPNQQDLGFRFEAYVHTRLIDHLAKIPQKSNIYYYKPFKIKQANDALSFGSGEIDFGPNQKIFLLKFHGRVSRLFYMIAILAHLISNHHFF